MTQEDKELLLRDLCARLPYDVKVWVKTHHGQIIESDFLTLCNGGGYYSTLSYEGILNDSIVKPYLRPMDSMTEEELKTYHSYCECDHGDFTGEILYFDTIESFDYLTSIHIDYRGLIPMGLAIEVTEENNPYKE